MICPSGPPYKVVFPEVLLSAILTDLGPLKSNLQIKHIRTVKRVWTQNWENYNRLKKKKKKKKGSFKRLKHQWPLIIKCSLDDIKFVIGGFQRHGILCHDMTRGANGVGWNLKNVKGKTGWRTLTQMDNCNLVIISVRPSPLAERTLSTPTHIKLCST